MTRQLTLSPSPSCTRCSENGAPCSYSTHEGETRFSAALRKSSELEAERDKAIELLRLLKSSRECDAQMFLSCVRDGANSVDDVARRVRDASALLELPPRGNDLWPLRDASGGPQRRVVGAEFLDPTRRLPPLPAVPVAPRMG